MGRGRERIWLVGALASFLLSGWLHTLRVDGDLESGSAIDQYVALFSYLIVGLGMHGKGFSWDV
jgi:hypothetical protein